MIKSRLKIHKHNSQRSICIISLQYEVYKLIYSPIFRGVMMKETGVREPGRIVIVFVLNNQR